MNRSLLVKIIGFLIVGGVGVFFLTHTRLGVNQTPSLSHKIFLCGGDKIKRGSYVSIHGHKTKYGSVYYTKRLLGKAGDKIEIKENRMYVGGRLIGTLRSHTQKGRPLHPLKVKEIPQGYVFVKGDHPYSFDSRYEEFGLVQQKHIRGRCLGFF